MMEYKIATEAASVGEHTPPRMPPRIITGMSSAGMARTKAWVICFGVYFSVLRGYLRLMLK